MGTALKLMYYYLSLTKYFCLLDTMETSIICNCPHKNSKASRKSDFSPQNKFALCSVPPPFLWYEDRAPEICSQLALGRLPSVCLQLVFCLRRTHSHHTITSSSIPG